VIFLETFQRLRGRELRDGRAVRFVDVVVNGPKAWSPATALRPEIASAYEAAQDRAATEIIGWLAPHGTTQVRPCDGQGASAGRGAGGG
jgi:exodeoxyribonuclease V alpha subunit